MVALREKVLNVGVGTFPVPMEQSPTATGTRLLGSRRTLVQIRMSVRSATSGTVERAIIVGA